jgi:hypothetical protein
VLAVAVAAAIVGGVLLVNGRSPQPGGSPAVAAAVSPSRSAPPTPATTASAHPSETAQPAGPKTSAFGSPRGSTPPPAKTPRTDTPDNTAPQHTSPPASTSPAPARAPLTVLNNSRIRGLAHRAAAHFADDGWTVAHVGNFSGRIPRTTVYYGPGGRGAAEDLAREFGKVTRVLPRFSGLPGSGLTVVLTRYYANPR